MQYLTLWPGSSPKGSQIDLLPRGYRLKGMPLSSPPNHAQLGPSLHGVAFSFRFGGPNNLEENLPIIGSIDKVSVRSRLDGFSRSKTTS